MPKTYHYIKRDLPAFASSTNLVRKVKKTLRHVELSLGSQYNLHFF